MNTDTGTPVPALVARPTVTPAGRWTSVAGAAYVVAWLAGLVAAPTAPGTDAVTVHAHYVAHGPALAVQALLVHGLAGLALAVLALALPRAIGLAGRPAALVRGSGLGAAAVSLLQTGLTLVALARAASAAPAATQALVHAVDGSDTVKLVLLAVFVRAVPVRARRASMLPRWTVLLAVTLAVLLPLGGAAFLVPNGLLMLLLVASLPLLLVWAGTVAVLVGRRAH